MNGFSPNPARSPGLTLGSWLFCCVLAVLVSCPNAILIQVVGARVCWANRCPADDRPRNLPDEDEMARSATSAETWRAARRPSGFHRSAGQDASRTGAGVSGHSLPQHLERHPGGGHPRRNGFGAPLRC